MFKLLFMFQVRASSIRRQEFSRLSMAHFGVDLQLLRDVDTRWSSTLLMIERGIFMQPVSSNHSG